jgi:alpha-galactosidase
MKFLFIALTVMVSAVEAFCQGDNYIPNYNKFDGLALTPTLG